MRTHTRIESGPEGRNLEQFEHPFGRPLCGRFDRPITPEKFRRFRTDRRWRSMAVRMRAIRAGQYIWGAAKEYRYALVGIQVC